MNPVNDRLSESEIQNLKFKHAKGNGKAMERQLEILFLVAFSRALIISV